MLIKIYETCSSELFPLYDMKQYDTRNDEVVVYDFAPRLLTIVRTSRLVS
jgi:hypothetical protein